MDNIDKYDLVFDIIEHPDRYTAEQLTEIMSDPETKGIYTLLCKTDSAAEAHKRRVDVDAEWESFADRHLRSRRPKFVLFAQNRAASIATFALTSLAAVAVGIAVSVNVTDNSHKIDDTGTEQAATTATSISSDSIKTRTDSVAAATILFDNATLGDIMDAVSKMYDVEVKFVNNDAASMRLYFKLNPGHSLDETVERLNTFEQINITVNGSTLTID